VAAAVPVEEAVPDHYHRVALPGIQHLLAREKSMSLKYEPASEKSMSLK